MKVLAVIPARGGNQRVRYKNIAPLLGRPMLAYTLDHARQSRTIDRVVVSTEDATIADVARREGAEVIDRPAALATPSARLDHVLRHAVETLTDRDGWVADIVVMLYGATPIRPPEFIDRCVERLLEVGADSIRSLTPASERHPLWSVKLDEQGRIDEYLGKGNVYRRQDLPAVYYYSGACVVVRSRWLMDPDAAQGDDNFAYFGVEQCGVVHEPDECVEIHAPIDIEWAEFLLTRKEKSSGAPPAPRRSVNE